MWQITRETVKRFSLAEILLMLAMNALARESANETSHPPNSYSANGKRSGAERPIWHALEHINAEIQPLPSIVGNILLADRVLVV
jgi:hypothetical protein